MYIDPQISKDFYDFFPNYKIDIKDLVENCGVWYTIKEMKKETNRIIEDMWSECYYVIDEDKILLCSTFNFWDNVEEYIYENKR